MNTCDVARKYKINRNTLASAMKQGLVSPEGYEPHKYPMGPQGGYQWNKKEIRRLIEFMILKKYFNSVTASKLVYGG